MAVTESDLKFMKEVLPFWEKITRKEQTRLEQAVTVRTYRQGENLHRGSEKCTGLIIVKSGQIRAFIVSDTGKEITLYRLLERDTCIFSAACVLKNINFDVELEAEHDSEILLVPPAVYNELNQNAIAVTDFTNQLMSSRFSDVMWVMEQVLFMSFDRRLANFLLEQCAIDGSDTLTITHEAIAKHLGSAREVVTRMLKYFQNEGMVSLTRGGITITDKKKLEKLQ